ncbi:hypothetical protein SEA_LUNA18_64 [Microbacterium phage Luna18]|nr:hypothetical protein SEA_CHEPLI_64 [Microbacterium phage Chepli]QZE10351.1 hypothetical protein SEA_KATCHAN_63 [Microbacterium phage KatChan]URQ04914.1 hypothetical protein SEA_LUNA18_64 [Microbacterium phage Luna18]
MHKRVTTTCIRFDDAYRIYYWAQRVSGLNFWSWTWHEREMPAP